MDPLILVLVLASGLLHVAWNVRVKTGTDPLEATSVTVWTATLVLVALVVFTPLPAMVLLGIEHTLQIVVDIAFVCVAAGVIAEPEPGERTRGGLVALYALAPLVTLVRYEGIFLILVAINFVVITKGAGRVAEVAARFTLDAMPGRQMSIDADLNAGIIDEIEARRRPREISREADI